MWNIQNTIRHQSEATAANDDDDDDREEEEKNTQSWENSISNLVIRVYVDSLF